MRRLLALVLLLALGAALVAPPAASQVVVYDPANWVQQILQYAQMLIDYYLQYEQLVHDVQQLVQLVEQVEMMLQNLEDLERFAADNPGRFLGDIRDLMRALEGVVYRADDVLIRYDDHYTPAVALDLPAEEEERVAETLATYRTLLAAARQTAGHSSEAATALGGLSGQLESAEGNLQALQAVGALTTQVATEVTRGNELHAMTLNALVVRYSHELAAREHSERTFLDWIERGKDVQSWPPPRTFDPVPDGFR